jgi:hypothetical protein
VRSHDRVPMGRDRSDIRAQRGGMIACVPSQDLIRIRKLNDSPRFEEARKELGTGTGKSLLSALHTSVLALHFYGRS